MRITRRQLTGGLALAAASAIVRSQAGSVPACLDKLEGKRVDIDIHCHIFNGSDLHVERFLRQVVAPEKPVWLRKALESLAPLLQRLTWEFAPRAAAELKRLEAFGKGSAAQTIGDAKLEEAVRQDEEEADRVFAEAFGALLRTPDGRAFLDAYGDYVDSVAAQSSEAARQLEAIGMVSELEMLARGDAEAVLEQMEKEEAAAAARLGMRKIFRSARSFMGYRYVKAYRVLTTYGCNHGTVQLLAAALVDYDFSLASGKSTPSPLPDQFAVMSRIAELLGGRVLPHLPYDPWRHVLEGPQVFKLLTGLISRGEAVGVKLYPPMGFAPFGNAQLLRPPPSWPPVPDFGRKLDAVLAEFWDFATRLDVPVLAHANMSNAAAADFVALGAPDNWAVALGKYNKARVCFGHFGGQMLLDSEEGWPERYLRLASGYPHVYGDFSYFEDVLGRRSHRRLRSRFAEFFDSAKPLAQQRTIYGSDWLMLAKESGSEQYFKRFDTLFTGTPFAANVHNDVFSANAIRFLGLGRGEKTRSRLEAFYKLRYVHAPWLRAVP